MDQPVSSIPIHCAYHELAPIGGLKPNPANPNKHPARQITLYAAAIQAHGWRESVTVSKLSGLIVRGHGAVLAARTIGATVIPVEYQDYASAAEELADLLADNRLAHLSTTDAPLLEAALRELDSAAITGYSSAEIADLLDEVAPLPEFPITAKLNERHDFLVVTVDNETDWQFLKNLAGVRTERSFKNNVIGEGRVIPFPRFLASLRENLHSIPSPIGRLRARKHDVCTCRHHRRSAKRSAKFCIGSGGRFKFLKSQLRGGRGRRKNQEPAEMAT